MNNDEINASLAFASDVFDDVQNSRIALEGRLRSLLQDRFDVKDEKGKIIKRVVPNDLGGIKMVEFGRAAGGMFAPMAAQLEALMPIEEQYARVLKSIYRKHAYYAWSKNLPGVGDLQGARLLAAVENPYWNFREDRPRRGPAELWRFSGFAPGQRRRRGEKLGFNPAVKMRAFLVAESCLKAGVRKLPGCDDAEGYDLEHRAGITELGKRYLAEREKHQGAVHEEPCPQCGGKERPPAPVGSALSEGHQHMRALRVVAKEVLKSAYNFGCDHGIVG